MAETLEIVKVRMIDYGVVELRSDDILVFRPDVATFKEYNLQILDDLHKVYVEITAGIPRPFMCDSRYVNGIVTKEEQTFINQKFGDFATHAALITHSSLIRMIVNSYTLFFKPKVEVRLFNTEEEAVKWLLKKAASKA